MNRRDKKEKATTLYVKNMVCNRCIRVVREELEKLGLRVERIVLGEVDITSRRTIDVGRIRDVLFENGFELIEDKRVKTIERIKQIIITLVQNDYRKTPLHLNYSDYIERELGHDYRSLSSLFSSVENVTIEQFIILQRIERVKELLKYREMTLSEIAFATGYSSVQHLSNQFRKITGMTPTYFKELKNSVRKPIDKVEV